MSGSKRRYRKHSIKFKKDLVLKMLSGERSMKSLAREYELSDDNIIKWTRRYLAGEPLEMKKGRKPKTEEVDLSDLSENELLNQIKKLKAELAYKNEVIKFLETEKKVKKKNASES